MHVTRMDCPTLVLIDELLHLLPQFPLESDRKSDQNEDEESKEGIKLNVIWNTNKT